MIIRYDQNGNVTWSFHRKAYRKSRWRKVGQRILNSTQKNHPNHAGLIIVI